MKVENQLNVTSNEIGSVTLTENEKETTPTNGLAEENINNIDSEEKEVILETNFSNSDNDSSINPPTTAIEKETTEMPSADSRVAEIIKNNLPIPDDIISKGAYTTEKVHEFEYELGKQNYISNN